MIRRERNRRDLTATPRAAIGPTNAALLHDCFMPGGVLVPTSQSIQPVRNQRPKAAPQFPLNGPARESTGRGIWLRVAVT